MQGYIWEKSVSVVPDVALDEHGSIIPIATEPDAVRKRRLQDGGVGESIRRGVIRYLYILVDWSVAMDEDDFRPTRGEVVYKALTVGGLPGRCVRSLMCETGNVLVHGLRLCLLDFVSASSEECNCACV